MNKNKYLLIAFGVLVLLLIWKQFFASSDSRNFREVLVELDTASVTKINVITKTNELKPVNFVKTGSLWEVSNGTISDEANLSTVRGMLSSMIKMKPKRLVAKSNDKWNQYEVSDSIGTKVEVFVGEDLIADLVVGKFSFEQNTRAMSTFVRLSEDDETYAVEGMLSSTFNQEFNNFRDRTFLKANKNDLTSLRFEYQGDNSYVLSKIDNKWNISSVAVDSIAIDNYLNGIQNLTKNEFEDDFSKDGKMAMYHLKIDGNNMAVIDVYGYMHEDELILHSSLNDNAYFKAGSLDVFDKLFVSSGRFLKK